MCGIAGFASNKTPKDTLELMTNRIAHRGPDATGYYYNANEGIGLGHRRLSIIDLSAAANQPFYLLMVDIMIYNGEIYNYKELSAKHNIHTKTNSDSEVLLECFASLGIQMFNELNGMFAGVIWDKVDKTLYLFRDRLGIKPLLYFINEQGLYFASELKSILAASVSKEINTLAIHQLLHLGYVPHPSTFIKGCFKLPAGFYGIYKNGELSLHKYWIPEDQINTKILSDEKKAKEELKNRSAKHKI